MRYQSTKTYGHDIGLSACFRQWRAHSHCNMLHGYAMSFKFTFEAEKLDSNNWVVDFGALKSLRGILENNFDHKLLIAEDDPALHNFKLLDNLGLVDMVVVPFVGCEGFAEMVYEVGSIWLVDNGFAPRVRLHSVEVREHGANSAIYKPEYVA